MCGFKAQGLCSVSLPLHLLPPVLQHRQWTKDQKRPCLPQSSFWVYQQRYCLTITIKENWLDRLKLGSLDLIMLIKCNHVCKTWMIIWNLSNFYFWLYNNKMYIVFYYKNLSIWNCPIDYTVTHRFHAKMYSRKMKDVGWKLTWQVFPRPISSPNIQPSWCFRHWVSHFTPSNW